MEALLVQELGGVVARREVEPSYLSLQEVGLNPTPDLTQNLGVLVPWDGCACPSLGPSKTWTIGRPTLAP